jgi:DNA-binding transcriptional LysR family regulator
MTIHLLAATSDLLMTLERRELELVIGRLANVRHAADFDFEPLSREEVWLFAADTHPFARRRRLRIES